jgi:hypothetical protein
MNKMYSLCNSLKDSNQAAIMNEFRESNILDELVWFRPSQHGAVLPVITRSREREREREREEEEEEEKWVNSHRLSSKRKKDREEGALICTHTLEGTLIYTRTLNIGEMRTNMKHC